MKKISCIYRIINLIDGKFYIGSTNHFHRRSKRHFVELRNSRHDNPHLQNAFNLYGEPNFKIEIIEEVPPDKIRSREQWYLDNTKCLDENFGYNIAPNVKTHIWTEKQRENHRKKLKAYWEKPENREKQSQRLKKICSTPEARKRLKKSGKIGNKTVKNERSGAKLPQEWIDNATKARESFFNTEEGKEIRKKMGKKISQIRTGSKKDPLTGKYNGFKSFSLYKE